MQQRLHQVGTRPACAKLHSAAAACAKMHSAAAACAKLHRAAADGPNCIAPQQLSVLSHRLCASLHQLCTKPHGTGRSAASAECDVLAPPARFLLCSQHSAASPQGEPPVWPCRRFRLVRAYEVTCREPLTRRYCAISAWLQHAAQQPRCAFASMVHMAPSAPVPSFGTATAWQQPAARHALLRYQRLAATCRAASSSRRRVVSGTSPRP